MKENRDHAALDLRAGRKWMPCVILGLLLLAMTWAKEAAAWSETFRSADGKEAVTLTGPSEVTIGTAEDTNGYSGAYTIEQSGKLRMVVTAPGKPQATYVVTNEGLLNAETGALLKRVPDSE